MDLGNTVQLFLTFCGAIVTIGAAGTVIYNVYKLRTTPDKERDVTLRSHSEMLDRDNKRLKELEESNKVIMQSLLALMSHELDGNHTEQLKKAKQELEEYLIHR